MPVGKHQNDDLTELPSGSYVEVYPGSYGGGDFTTATGGIVAINVADGTVAWETNIPTFVVGATTVANDLVFSSGLDGFFRAFDVATGQEVWSYEAAAGINAPPAIAGDMIV